MSECIEIIVMSYGPDNKAAVHFLDPTSGTELRSMKSGGEIEANCLSFVGNDYLLFSISKQPIIYTRKVNGNLPGVGNKIKVQGCVSALAVSPNSRYCVFGIGSSIKVLSLESGKITSCGDKHFQCISSIKFTDDGSCFVTAGLDGLIVVWNLAYILSFTGQKRKASQLRAMHVFKSHSLPVTDLHVGHGGMQAFIVSVSAHVCKIHSLADGNLILSLIFECALNAVTMSVTESELFVGTVKGDIYKCSLNHMPRTRDYHMSEEDLAFHYRGHDKAISSLSTSLDGLHLLSGSNDGRIILWDIKSGQAVKVLKYSHPVHNVHFAICPKNVFLQSFDLSTSVKLKGNDSNSFYRKSGLRSFSDESERLLSDQCSVFDSNFSSKVSKMPMLDCENSRLRYINRQLFVMTVESVLENN